MRKKKSDQGFGNLWKIYRRATANDLKQYREAIKLEKPVLISARKIIKKLGLEMKLGDVEYQGDKKKAIFYYIADDRVDFRELIKLLAAEFGIRVEMKQIGARQEAGRIGGIGSCGRELCCSSWKTDLHSVSLNVAKIQDLPANAQKLAGQCGKLKCCLMYELDTYLEAREEIPNTLLELETEKGTAYHRRTDLLNRIMYYSYDDALAEDLIPVPVEKVKEVINLNKRGIRVELTAYISTVKRPEESIRYFTEAESITRFDSMHKNKKKNRGRKRL